MIDYQKQTAILSKLITDPKVKTFRLALRGNSMLPLLKPETEARFQKIRSGRPPAIGDVAAIKYQNGFLVHRIILTRGLKNDREYFTKGDRRLAGDGWVKIDRIAGIRMWERRYQRIIDWTAAGFSALLWCVGKLLRRGRKR